jgi:hypothetical protein
VEFAAAILRTKQKAVRRQAPDRFLIMKPPETTALLIR